MGDEMEEKPKRGRPPRQQQEQQRRRRRTDNLDGARYKLRVDESLLDRENYEYRYVVDRGDRLRAMTQDDDWDIVTQDGNGVVKEDSTDLGAAVSVVSGTKEDGSPERLYLCRKPKEFAEEDRAAKERRRQEIDEQMRTLGRADAGVSGGDYYNPQGRNTIS